METIELKDRVIYRPEKGKKVRFKGEPTRLFSEIALAEPSDEIEEVDEDAEEDNQP